MTIVQEVIASYIIATSELRISLRQRNKTLVERSYWLSRNSFIQKFLKTTNWMKLFFSHHGGVRTVTERLVRLHTKRGVH